MKKTLHRDLVEARDGLFRRSFRAERGAVNKDTRTVELAFSSEEPYERWWGIEVLDHSESSVRLGRLNDGAHPLLVNHDWNRQPGVIEKAWIGDDRMGRAVARFGRSAYAEEILADVEDGIRSLVSVGYIVHKVIEQSTSKGAEPTERELTGDEFRALVRSEEFHRSMVARRAAGDDTPVYRVVDWEPYEASIVAIPADASVGVGRSIDGAQAPIETHKEPIMGDETKGQPAASVPDIQAITNAARESEIARSREILALGAIHNRQELAQKAVAEGTSLDQFRGDLLVELTRGQPKPTPEIGMTEREVRQFSIVRAIHAMAEMKANPQNAAAARAMAAFEFEASAAAAAKTGKESRGIMIPFDVLAARRDLTTSTASGTSKAGNLVATDLLAGSFIDVLRNKLVLPSAGATFLTGLQGNIAVPKKATGATSYWVAENSAPTEGALTFGQVTMSPKTVAAFVDFSRRLTLQSSLDVEAMVRDDLTSSLSLAIDEAGIGTSGSNRPTGVRGTSGIGSVAIGTNGGAPTWAAIVNLEKEVDIDNAMIGSAAYVTNSKVRAKLKQTPKQASGVEGNWLLGAPYNELNGYPLVVSNQVPSNLTKGGTSGTCSAMFFGVWSNLVIGQWGGIDLLVDPYTGSSAGTVRVTAFADVDVAVRYPEAFAACLDLTTT